jgi:membrane-associated phospholipid phosphatase
MVLKKSLQKVQNKARSEAITNSSSRCLPGFKELHKFLYPFVTGPKFNLAIMKWQRYCGLDEEGNPGSTLVHFYMKFASTLGDEAFYLFPLLVWCAYPLAGPFVTCMGCILPLGQFVKDMMHLPRPPKVFKYIENGKENTGSICKLEEAFATEYGLPSTHAMSGSLSFCVLRTLISLQSCEILNREGMTIFGLPWQGSIICILIIVSVCCSRLYMGVHSLCDIVAGLFISMCMQTLISAYEPELSTFVFSSDLGIFVAPLVTVVFLLFYPRVQHAWSASYSTASELFGLWVGMSISMWTANVLMPQVGIDLRKFSLIHDSCSSLETVSIEPKTMMLRLLSGCVVVGVARTLAKNIYFPLFLWLHSIGAVAQMQHRVDTEGKAVPLRRAYSVEIPARIFTLVTTSMVCVVGVPLMWSKWRIFM